MQDLHHVVAACDDIFAMPLAATAVSVCAASADPSRLHFTVIDCGLSARSRSRIRRSVEGAGAAVALPRFAWEIPAQALRSGAIPAVAAYARLFAADYVPPTDRALYLDSDTVVRCDVADVLSLLRPDAVIAGVPDPQGDGRIGNIDRLRPFLAGAGQDSAYVNSGVLALNLDTWRAERLSERCADLLGSGTFAFGDQDVVNIAAAGRVQKLAPELNVQTHLLADLPPAARQATLREARIIHYTRRPKPWHRGGDGEDAAPWYDAVDGTAWRGWRPTGARLVAPKVRRGLRMARTQPTKLLSRLVGAASR